MQTRRDYRNKFYHIISKGGHFMDLANQCVNVMTEFGGEMVNRAIPTAHYDTINGLSKEESLYNFLEQYRNLLPLTDPPPLKKIGIGLKNTKLILSGQFIREYDGRHGKHVKVTNWFNPSIIRYKGKIIFAYRMDMQPFCVHTRIGICKMDEDLNVIPNTNKVLSLVSKRIQEDPRLHIFNDELYITYADGIGKLGIGKINPDTLECNDSVYLPNPKRKRIEKNWTFFEGGERHNMVYSICPHVIFRVNGTYISKCADTTWTHNWRYGQMRGGTSPVLHDGMFYSFFHSAVDLHYVKDDYVGRQYFIGCYVFDGKYPFAPKFVSKEPILAGEMCDEKIPRLSNKLAVLFPNGHIRNKTNDGNIVAFGNNDLECRYVDIKDDFLQSNLIKV